jgi:hypothetical protein
MLLGDETSLVDGISHNECQILVQVIGNLACG